MRIARALGLAAVFVMAAGAAASAGEVAEPQQADAVEAMFDDTGVLHLVIDLATGDPNQLVHRSRAPGGPWSEPEQLASDFLSAGPRMELVRRPDGAVCLFFNGQRVASDIGSVGLYLRCLEDAAWTAARQVGVGVGDTATFDGAFDAAGAAHGLYAVPGWIGYGDVVVWTGNTGPGWPSLAIDGDGTLHAAWAAFGNPIGMFTSRSRDGGATWTAAESLTGVARADVPFDLVSDRSGSVHVLFPGTPSMYRTWTNGAWTPIVELPTDMGPKRLAIGADGLATVAWASDDAISVMRQRPDGSWSAPVLVDTPATPPTHLAVAADASGAVVVAWTGAAGVSIAALGAESFADSVPSPFEITLDPVIVAQSVALAAGVVLLVPLPAALFNQTLEANYGRISAGLAGFRRRLLGRRQRLATFWRRPSGIVAFFLIAALISAFLDPTLGFSAHAAMTVAGLFIGLVVVATAFTLPSILLHRLHRRGGARIDVRPLGLPIAVASVAISRLTSFQPGYLYGLLAGVELQGSPRAGDVARGVAASNAWALLLAFGAWFGLVPVREVLASPDPPLWALAAESALATIVVSGLEGVVFGLLPLAITPGGVLFRERRRMWALLMAIGAFAFFHVLVNPTSGYLVDSSRVPLITTVVLFVGFAALTAGTWLYFRLRPGRGVEPRET